MGTGRFPSLVAGFDPVGGWFSATNGSRESDLLRKSQGPQTTDGDMPWNSLSQVVPCLLWLRSRCFPARFAKTVGGVVAPDAVHALGMEELTNQQRGAKAY
jgi:hypothetical protein